MPELLLFLATAWILTAAGRTVLQLLRLPDTATRLERNLCGYALGLGLLAYSMLSLGLLALLYTAAGWGLLLVLLGLGASQNRTMALEGWEAIRGGIHLSPIGWATFVLFAALAVIPQFGVWTPPVQALGSAFYTEWDSLAYHLADPKLYLAAHRIYYLPWESHSNFAFTAEMWYLFALMQRGTEQGVPLAKLFHYSCGVGACLAIYAFGARHVSRKVGVVAALLTASTPLVLWEAGTAYADLAPMFFTTLTLLAVGTGVQSGRWGWLVVGAVLMGLTLSTKATSLTTLALLAGGLLLWRLRSKQQPWPRAVASVAAWCLIVLAVGSPWYVKSAIYTGNPIYPFYSKIFPSRYWNADLGASYDASNANFGVGKTLSEVHSPTAAILAPWNLTLYLVPGHPPPGPGFRPFNDFQSPLAALSPLLLAALFFPAFIRGVPGSMKALGLYGLCSLTLWFVTVQYARYLLPTLPVLCLLSAWVLVQVWEERWLSRYALAALSACSLAFTLLVGAELIFREAPVVFGQQSRAEFITHGFSAFPAMQYINRALPPNTKIIFYNAPLGFYCDRAYLWGDPQHSTYVPYDSFRTAEDYRAFLAKIGVTHILINRLGYDVLPGENDYRRWVYALTDGTAPPIFEERGVAVYALPPWKG